MPKLDRSNYKPLYIQLNEAIKEYIRKNNMKPGSPLPSQNELVEEFGVSQVTVRQALQCLATEGLILKVQGKGTYVSEPKMKHNVDRILSLEEQFAEKNIIVKYELVEELLVYPTDMYYNELKLPAGSQAYRIRRLQKINDTVFGLEKCLFPAYVREYISSDDLNTKPIFSILGRHSDLAIKRIEYRVRSMIVLDIESEVMGLSPDSNVLVHRGVFFNRANEPVMSARVVYPADKIEIYHEVRSTEDRSYRFKG